MFWNRKKKKEDEENAAEDTNAENESQEDTGSDDGAHHAIGDGSDGVPQALKDKLAEIRGEQDPGYTEVEVDDKGNAINPEDADLLKTGSEVTEGDTASGDAVNQSSEEDSTSEAEADEDANSEYEEVELDSRLVEAGKAMSWSDDRIRLVAETDISILEDIATRLESTESHRREESKDEKKEDTDESSGLVDEEALAKLKEKLGDGGDEVLDALLKGVEAKFASKFKDVDDLKASNEEINRRRELTHKGTVADDVFDQHAKQFAEFGVTKDLKKDGVIPETTPEFKVRSKVFAVAAMFHEANGGSFERAMQDAVQHYAGGQSNTIASRRLVKDLNKNKRRFTPRPTERKTVRVFKNTDAKKSHIVQKAMKRAGIK